MNKKTDLVFEYFEKKYEFDIQKLGIDKYQINHFFQSNNKYFDSKESIKLLILQIEKNIDSQIKDNKKFISQDNMFLKNENEKMPVMKPIIITQPPPPIIKNDFIYLYIDSKDRDLTDYKYPNNFSIKIKPIKLKNIQLLEVIIKNSEQDQDSSDSMDKFPYLILNISIYKKNNIGSNNILTNSSIILSNYEVKSGFKYYNINGNIIDLEDKKIDLIRIEFLKPNGESFYFGFNNSQSMNTINFLKFKAVLF